MQGQPALPVVAVIQAQKVDPVVPQNIAFWIKFVPTSSPESIGVNDRMGRHNRFENPGVAALHDKPETDAWWHVLQAGFVDQMSRALLPKCATSVVIRYKFFRYKGSLGDQEWVAPKAAETPRGNALIAFVGHCVGEQIAGLNAVVQAVPETWALMLAGIVMACGLVRRRS